MEYVEEMGCWDLDAIAPFEFLREDGGALTNEIFQNPEGNDPQHGGGAAITTMMVVGGADDPCCYSDSNSGASATESRSNITKKDHNGCGEANHGKRRISLKIKKVTVSIV